MAGLNNKNREFWKRLQDWEIIIMIETWIDEKGWEKIEGKLPKEYEWKAQLAKRRN